MNNKGGFNYLIFFGIFISIIFFYIFLQLYIPFATDLLFPILENVAYGNLIQVILEYIPLIIIAIIVGFIISESRRTPIPGGV